MHAYDWCDRLSKAPANDEPPPHPIRASASGLGDVSIAEYAIIQQGYIRNARVENRCGAQLDGKHSLAGNWPPLTRWLVVVMSFVHCRGIQHDYLAVVVVALAASLVAGFGLPLLWRPTGPRLRGKGHGLLRGGGDSDSSARGGVKEP